MDKINVAVVGLRFGGAFPTIYRDHPNVGSVAICDSDRTVLDSYGDRHGFKDRFNDYGDLLASGKVDAIHIVTPLARHVGMSVAALDAGKHCACTVPMAMTIDGLREVIAAQRRSGRNYMMMETAAYTRHYMYVKDMLNAGEMGNVQFLRGAHYQDLEGWPDYWKGLPPLHYATHAVAPILGLSGSRAVKVHCFGSGAMRDELVANYGNPYPIETAIMKLDKGPLAAEFSRSLFHTARDYVESFTVLGDRKSFEWNLEGENPIVYELLPLNEGSRGSGVRHERVLLPDYGHLLPEPLRRYTQYVTVADPNNPHMSTLQGGAHHGSHPHLVHEFVMSVVEGRKPFPDEVTSAEWCAAGICAHESAMKGGEGVEVPDFRA